MNASRDRQTEGRDDLDPVSSGLFWRLAQAPRSPIWFAYALSFLGIVLATLLRLALGRWFGPELSPFLTYYPLIILVALLFGAGAGVAATVFAGLAVAYFFLPPAGFGVHRPHDIVGLFFFCGINGAMSFICAAFRSARHRGFTETRRAQASEESFRRFMDNTPTLVWVKDEQRRYVYINRAYEQRFGVTLDQYRGKTDLQLWQPAVAARLQEADRAALAAGRPTELTEEVTEPDGSSSFWLNSKFIYHDATGERFIASIGLDITPRKQAEEALLKEKSFADEVINSLPGVFYLFDAHFRLRRWNRNFETLSGYSADQLQRMRLFDFVAPEHHAFARSAIATVLASGEASAELLFITKDRRKIPFSFSGRRFSVEGRPGFLGVGLDITERKEAEQSLRETEERFRVLFEGSPLSAFLIDPQTQRVLDCNEQASRSLGYTREQLLKLRIADFEAQLGPEQIANSVSQVASEGHLSVESRHRTRTGEVREVIVTARPLRLQGRYVHYATATDITEQKHARLTLQRRNQHLQILHELAAGLLAGQHPVSLLSELHPRIAQSFGADVFMIYQPEEGSTRLELTACRGITREEQLRLESYGRAVCTRPSEALHPLAVTNIQNTDAPDGRFIRKLGFRSYLCYPLVLNHRLQGTLAFASRHRDDYDATDLDFFHTVAGTLAEALERHRLQSELQKHADNLDRVVHERTARLEQIVADLEHFSYTITHDMRAPLRAMTGFAQMLSAAHAQFLPEPGRDLLRRISEGARRMDHLITDALQYDRVLRSKLRLEPLDPSSTIRGIVEGYPDFQPPRADIEIVSPMPRVLANEAALTQIFSNLLGNAVKFVAPGVKPHVRVWAETVPPSSRHENPKASRTNKLPGASVRIYVEDNGIGIAPEYQSKIWEMFHQIDKSYEGTGIGLALVRKVVEQMNGTVGVESEPGRGSRFRIDLPNAEYVERSKELVHTE